MSAPSEVVGWLAEAKKVARERYGTELFLDLRDANALARIVRALHDRHVQSPFPPAELRAEVLRWGAVCSQLAGQVFSPCHWGPAKMANLSYGHSVFIPLEGGGWAEDNCFDHVETLITRPGPRKGLTIEAELTLGHFLD